MTKQLYLTIIAHEILPAPLAQQYLCNFIAYAVPLGLGVS